MARYRGSLCRLCRREGEKLFLKGERCLTGKCAIERRNYVPGIHGQRRTKLTDYAYQFREKQKVKRIYGVLENQFRGYYKMADSKAGITGELLLELLERRLDNVVYRLGMAPNRNAARQIIRHNHILVNGKRVNIASFRVKPGDEVEVKEPSRKIPVIMSAVEKKDVGAMPPWLTMDLEKFKGVITDKPSRQDIQTPIREQLIIELYSK